VLEEGGGGEQRRAYEQRLPAVDPVPGARQ